MAIQFQGYNIIPKYLKTDKSWRIEIDVSQDQIDNIEEVIKILPEGIYDIKITPIVE